MKKVLLMLTFLISITLFSSFTPVTDPPTKSNKANFVTSYMSDFIRMSLFHDYHQTQQKIKSDLSESIKISGPLKLKKDGGTYLWWNFIGGYGQQWNPYYYYIDDNQYPECYDMLGYTYCEIRALPREADPTTPDLTTVVSQRYQPYYFP